MSKTYLDKNGLTYFWGKIKNAINKNTTPAGAITIFGGTTAPNGWLICDGSEVSRTTYADLFAVIGTTYGSGDGATTFKLPDIRGLFPIGYDPNDTDFNTLGKTGGSKTDDLSNAYAKIGISSDGHIYAAESGGSYNASRSLSGGYAGASGSKHNSSGLGGSVSTLPPHIVFNYIIKY